MKLFTKFFKDESGAVTVDWVVLTAAVVGLAFAVMASVQNGTNSVAGAIETELNSITVDSGQQ